MIMRRLRNSVGTLVIAVLTLIGGISCSPSITKEQYLASAAEYFDQGKLLEAQLEHVETA